MAALGFEPGSFRMGVSVFDHQTNSNSQVAKNLNYSFQDFNGIDYANHVFQKGLGFGNLLSQHFPKVINWNRLQNHLKGIFKLYLSVTNNIIPLQLQL